MKISNKKLAIFFIILGVIIFLVCLTVGIITSCNLWRTDKSYSGVSMMDFALERMKNEWIGAFVLGALPIVVGIIILFWHKIFKKEKNS